MVTTTEHCHENHMVCLCVAVHMDSSIVLNSSLACTRSIRPFQDALPVSFGQNCLHLTF